MSRGRSKELIEKRDTALLKRYYHLSEEKRIRLDDVLKMLSEEFYISDDRIFAIIREKIKQGATVKGNPLPSKQGFTGFRVSPIERVEYQELPL